jgi:hypothetical protein
VPLIRIEPETTAPGLPLQPALECAYRCRQRPSQIQLAVHAIARQYIEDVDLAARQVVCPVAGGALRRQTGRRSLGCITPLILEGTRLAEQHIVGRLAVDLVPARRNETGNNVESKLERDMRRAQLLNEVEKERLDAQNRLRMAGGRIKL